VWYNSKADKKLKVKGYQLIPVNPKADSIEGDRCYRSLVALPNRVDGVLEGYPPLTYRNHSRDHSEHSLLH
jgi:uncharacterized protein